MKTKPSGYTSALQGHYSRHLLWGYSVKISSNPSVYKGTVQCGISHLATCLQVCCRIHEPSNSENIIQTPAHFNNIVSGVSIKLRCNDRFHYSDYVYQ